MVYDPAIARSYLELADLMQQEGCGVSLINGRYGEFCHPHVTEDAPLEPVFCYPGRNLPGAIILEAYRKAERRLAERAYGRRRRFPAGVMTFKPRGRGVREHLVLIPLPTLLVLLKESGRSVRP